MRGSRVTGGGAPAKRPHVGVEALRLEESEAEVWSRLESGLEVGFTRDRFGNLQVSDFRLPATGQIGGVKVA